uniref:Ig-like domain-containing protein n=1 Tax=Oreochromis aureus TaxID=47969 RepID=A0A668UT89_OREAU
GARTELYYLIFFLFFSTFPSVGQKEVKVTRGEDATLECYGPSGATDILLRWTKDEGYVIYLKDGHLQEHLQDPSFKGRVKLKDSKWMKNGNFSVILQNVTMNDSGTYECESINLKVKEGECEVELLSDLLLNCSQFERPQMEISVYIHSTHSHSAFRVTDVLRTDRS